MPYCQHCGGEVDSLPESAAAEVVDREVEIARINAERDIKVAQISARQERDYNETHVEVAEVEADAQVATAEAEAEVIGEIIAAEADAEPEPEPVPVVVEPGPLPEAGPDIPAPPEAEHSAPREPKRKSGMFGF